MTQVGDWYRKKTHVAMEVSVYAFAVSGIAGLSEQYVITALALFVTITAYGLFRYYYDLITSHWRWDPPPIKHQIIAAGVSKEAPVFSISFRWDDVWTTCIDVG